MTSQNTQGKAKVVLVACVLFNLFLGVLYAWSVLRANFTLPVSEGGWGWTSSQAGLPFSLAIACFAVTMMIAGRIQDKIGPRWVLTAGGALCGLGLIISGLIGNNPLGIAIAFGVIAGIGGGAGYASVTPPALKWFHPSKKGTIAGLTVGGFGLSAVYYSPLAGTLMGRFGPETAMIIIGIGIFVLTILCAQFVKNPPAGYTPALPANFDESKTQTAKAPAYDLKWREMMKTKTFWMIFIMFVASASVGLMVIGNVTSIARAQMGINDGGIFAMLAALLAFVNTFGRVVGGMVSDKIGRINTLYLGLVLQTATMFGFLFFTNLPTLILGVVVIGSCFGAFLSVFPSLTADQFGLKNFGQNYGIMFLAWGVAGIVTPMLANFLYDLNGNFYAAYIICAVMTALMIIVNFLIKKDIDSRAAKAQSTDS